MGNDKISIKNLNHFCKYRQVLIIAYPRGRKQAVKGSLDLSSHYNGLRHIFNT